MILQLVANEAAPNFIGLPDSMEVMLSFGGREIFEEDAVKEQEGGDAHIGGAMNEDRAVIKSRHNAAEGAEVLRGRRLEIDGDMDVGHSETGDEAAFVRERIIGSREAEIDNGLKTSFADLAKLFLSGLPSGGEFRTERTEVVDVGKRGGFHNSTIPLAGIASACNQPDAQRTIAFFG